MLLPSSAMDYLSWMFFSLHFLQVKKRSNYVVFVFCCYCIKRAEELFMALYKILANNPYAISDIIILIGQLYDWLFACAVLMKQTLCRLNRLFRNISFCYQWNYENEISWNLILQTIKKLYDTVLCSNNINRDSNWYFCLKCPLHCQNCVDK